MKHISLLLLFLAFLLPAQPVPVSDADWAALKSQALARPRRIIVNNDGCDYTSFPLKTPFSREALYAQMMDKAIGYEIDTISYCPYAVGLQTTTRSDVAPQYLHPIFQNKRNLHPEIRQLGTDSLQLAVDFARQHHFEIFAALRVNDHHDQWYPEALSQNKKDHPELLFGTPDHKPPYGSWTGFDFAQPAVRELFTGILREFVERYDIDGLELDFNRMPTFFKTVAWGGIATDAEREAFTAMMRTVRRNADAAGRQRRRYHLIAIRVPDDLDLCHDMGLDVRRWCAEGLVDILCLGGDVGRLHTFADAIAMGHACGVKVYPSIDTSWMKETGVFSRNSLAAYTAQSAAALQAGADGIYYFNMFYAPRFMKLMRRNLADLAFMDKIVLPKAQNYANYSAQRPRYEAISGTFGYRTPITYGNAPCTIAFESADDLTQPGVAARRPLVTLFLQTDSATPLLSATLNGTTLPRAHFANGLYRFDVPPHALHPGRNFATVAIDTAVAKPHLTTILKGDVLLKGANQPPWRRLYDVHDVANSEAIVDASYRFRDTGTADGQCANFIYPLANFRNDTLHVDFDVLYEDGSDDDAVVLRLANGVAVEQLQFTADRLALKYAKVSVPLPCRNIWHHVAVDMTATHIRVTVDDRPTFNSPLTMPVTDPAGKLPPAKYRIPLMDEQSLLIGSLTGPGTASSRWKNLRATIAPRLQLQDSALEIHFRGDEDPRLPALATADLGAPHAAVYANNGQLTLPAGFVNTYAADYCRVTDHQTLLLNHNHPRNPYQSFSSQRPQFCTPTSRYLVAEWRVKLLPPTTAPKHNLFTFGLRPQTANGTVQLIFRHYPNRIEGPNRLSTCLPDDDFVTVRIALNTITRQALLACHGEVIEGTAEPSSDKPSIFFGDASSLTSGAAELAFARFWTVD